MKPSSVRWDPREIEARKRVVARIAKRRRPPEEIRVSVFEHGGHLYADVRVYRGSSRPWPTRNGLPIHFDLLPGVLAALTALQGGSDAARVGVAEVSMDVADEAPWRRTDGTAGEAMTGVSGPW